MTERWCCSGNAEDCRLCDTRTLPYPWICPGHPDTPENRQTANAPATKSKPPVPAKTFDPWPRIPVDTSRGSDFHHLNRIAGHAATHWALGPDGTHARSLTLAETVDEAVRQALLHLLELGFIDIDSDRMNGSPGWPMNRESHQP